MSSPTRYGVLGSLLLSAFASGGCASVRYGIGAQPYVPWFAHSEAARATTFRAALTVLQQLSPAEITFDQRLYKVRAVVADSAETRDVYSVEVHERGEVMIEVRTELKDGDAWYGGSGVCNPYDYGRERFLGQRIVDYASAAAYQLALAN